MAQLAPQMLETELAIERHGTLRRLSTDPEERWHWANHDLASLVENDFATILEPARVTDRERREWGPRVRSCAREHPPTPSAAYWILHDARRVGTLCISRAPSLDGLTLSSLYVLPKERGRGHGTRALRAVREATRELGLNGPRLFTEWSWQRAVRWYLGLGTWVLGAEDCLELGWGRDLPAFAFEQAGEWARFVVDPAGTRACWLHAAVRGTHVEWVDLGAPQGTAAAARSAAPATFALALALRGYPLTTRTAVPFADDRRLDAFVRRLEHFEARDRARGYRSVAPGDAVPW